MTDARPVPWEIDPQKAALLIVDMQNDFVGEGAVMEVPMARQFLPNMRRILDHCRGRGIPVVFTRHVLYDHMDISPLEAAYNPLLRTAGMRAGTPGVEVVDELKPLPTETVIDKHRYDAFHNTRLETVLRNARGASTIDTVIVTGTVTNVCCESTARSAFMRDFKVAFISDANGGLDEASHQATLKILGMVFARVMPTDELLASL